MRNLRKYKNGLRTFLILFFMFSSSVFILDGMVLRLFVPRLLNYAEKSALSYPSKVFNTNRLESPSAPNKPKTYINITNAHPPPGRSVKYFKYFSDEYTEALKKLGFGRAEDHEFKSPYIMTPLLYDSHLVMKAPGVRKTKIISFHRIRQHNRWMIIYNKLNRDFKRCPYSECQIDMEGSLTQKADLVFFLCKGLVSPPPRPPGQLWAFGCWEPSPYWNYPNYDVWKDAFNVTIHHYLDADIVFPDVLMSWRHESTLLKFEEYLAFAKQKTKTAVWWVSNCRKDRMDFVKRMQKYIDIDIKGPCGTYKLCRKNVESDCRRELNTTYKFYLGFENSFCKDYVTNKLGRNYEQRIQIVPVVKSGVDYEKNFPAGSYVNGNKFKTAEQLALYLKELGDDLPRYAKMLQEGDKLISIPEDVHIDWCKVCEDLHTRKFGVHKDIKSWTHTNKCTKWDY